MVGAAREFIDLNDDGLPDMVISIGEYEEGQPQYSYDMNCVYINTGKGWQLE